MARKQPERGWKKNGVEFKLDNEDMYHYEAFTGGNVSREDVRKEYSRLRQTALKRLQRMEGTKYENTQSYIRNAGKYGTLDQIEKQALANAKNLKPEAAQKYVDAVVAKKLADVYKFLTAKTGSIRGMQKVENDLIDALNDRGYTFINKKNIQQFGEYMEYLRALHNGKQFDSERAGELFGIAAKKGIPPEEVAKDFEYWKTRVDELAKLPKAKNHKQRTAEHYKKLLKDK